MSRSLLLNLVTALVSSSLMLILSSAPATAAGIPTFGAPMRYSTPYHATDDFLCDLNGDGSEDIVMLGDRLRVWMNTGAGTFGPFAEYRWTDFYFVPQTGAAADVNNDGRPDIICAVWPRLCVFSQAPDNTFDPYHWTDMGGNAVDLVTADFFADGNIDVAAVFNGDSTVGLLLNPGLGFFGPAVKYPAGGVTQSLVAEDFDGDGQVDLATALPDLGQVSILLNDGAGGLAAPVLWEAGSTPKDLVEVDFDLDGDIDLVVANEAMDSITVLLNDGSGQFSQRLGALVGDAPGAIDAGDVNGDGRIDLVVSNDSSLSVQVIINVAPGVVVVSPPNPVEVTSRIVELSDVDSDGDEDLVSLLSAGYGAEVRLNDGMGDFFSLVPVVSPGGETPLQIGTADFDRDGDADAVVASRVDKSVTVLINSGSGAFVAMPSLSLTGEPWHLAAGDLDGDGAADVAVQTRFPYVLTLLFNDGTGGLVEGASYPLDDTVLWIGGVTTGDVDNDGDADLVEAMGRDAVYANGSIVVRLNAGDGTFGAPPAAYPVRVAPRGVSVGDFNNDGAVDIAVGNHNSGSISFLYNAGNGVFPTSQELILEQYQQQPSYPTLTAAADVDSDGDCDLAVAGTYVTVCRNLGAGVFELDSSHGLGNLATILEVADLDLDGSVELIAGLRGGKSLQIFTDHERDQYAHTFSILSDPTTDAMCAADFDGDEDVDLVVVHSNLNSVSLIRNLGQAPGCCVGIRGNVNGDPGDAVNVSDVTYLVSYLFRAGTAPTCVAEANVDGSGGSGSFVTVADLTYLVGYVFRHLSAPVACP